MMRCLLLLFFSFAIVLPLSAYSDVAFRSKSWTSGTGTSVTPTEPAGAKANDILIMYFVNDAVTSGFNAPAGWSLINLVNGTNSKVRGYWIRRGGSAPNFATTWTTSAYYEVTVTAWSGVVTTGNPWDVKANNGASQSNPPDPDDPSVTTTVANTEIVAIGMGYNGWTSTATPPAGYTIREAGQAGSRFAVASFSKSSIGAVDPGPFSGQAAGLNDVGGVTIALKPFIPSSSISFVQVKENSATANTNSINTGSFSIGGGNLIVCSVRYGSSTASVSSVTDNSGHTYTKAVGPTTGPGTISSTRTEIWYTYNTTENASLDITATMSSTFNSYKGITCNEYLGALTTSDPLDVTAANTLTSTRDGLSGTATTSQPGDLVYANCVASAASVGGAFFPYRSIQDNYLTADKNIGVIATTQASCQTAANADWIVQMAAFKAADTALPSGISLIQGNNSLLFGVSSVAQSFEGVNSSHNMILVGVYTYGIGRTLTVSDSNGNTYVQAGTVTQATDGHQIWLYYAMNVASGANTVSVSMSGGAATYAALTIAEYHGLATSGVLDKTNTNTNDTALIITTGTTAATTSATELVTGFFGFSNSGGTYSATGSSSRRDRIGYLISAYQDKIVYSTGTQSSTGIATSNQNYSAIVATFKVVSGRIRHRVNNE